MNRPGQKGFRVKTPKKKAPKKGAEVRNATFVLTITLTHSRMMKRETATQSPRRSEDVPRKTRMMHLRQRKRRAGERKPLPQRTTKRLRRRSNLRKQGVRKLQP